MFGLLLGFVRTGYIVCIVSAVCKDPWISLDCLNCLDCLAFWACLFGKSNLHVEPPTCGNLPEVIPGADSATPLSSKSLSSDAVTVKTTKPLS